MLAIAAGGFAAGALNAVAGGGTFLTLPLLIFLGIPPQVANGTSTAALWPASASAAWGYRAHWPKALDTRPLILVSLAGGALGAWVLVHTPAPVFVKVLPLLLLAAALAFTFSSRRPARKNAWGLALWWLAQFLIAVYGGYFGGGSGLLMLATMAMSGMTDIHQMNALKAVLGAAFNAAAALALIGSGLIEVQTAVVLSVAAIIGSLATARFATRLPQKISRALVLTLAWSVTVAFFVKTYAL
jgi:uncharacterized membrane protein YfcA